MTRSYIQPMRLAGLLLIGLLFWGCPAPAPDDTTVLPPITDIQFNFNEVENELYFAATITTTYAGAPLDTAGVVWYGTGGLSGAVDSLFLNDGGTLGDILARDGIYSRRVSNSGALLSNPITINDSGLVYFRFFADYIDTIAIVTDSTHLGNLAPVLIAADLDTAGTFVITANDTDFVITRPVDDSMILVLIRATVTDPNGLNDLSWVGFTSLHVGPDTLLNRGQPIYLYDDGSEVILYAPDLTSGDEVKNDGVFSFAVPVYGLTNESGQTKTGLFRWSFQAADLAGERSEILTLLVAVR
ncbi:MAG: hypothetical protein ABIA75_06990 [Candidatus Neomarinimicrobiota bacterium]